MQFIKCIISFAFSALVLLSTTSFSTHIHLCKNEVQSIALFTKAESCKKDLDANQCPMHQASDKDCCSDKVINIKGSDEGLSFLHADFTKKLIVSNIISNYNLEATPIYSTSYFHNNTIHPPPLHWQKIEPQAAFQQFLI